MNPDCDYPSIHIERLHVQLLPVINFHHQEQDAVIYTQSKRERHWDTHTSVRPLFLAPSLSLSPIQSLSVLTLHTNCYVKSGLFQCNIYVHTGSFRLAQRNVTVSQANHIETHWKNAMVKWFSQRNSTAHIAKECLKEIEREKDEQLTVFYISIRNVYLHVHIGYLFCLTCSTVSVNQWQYDALFFNRMNQNGKVFHLHSNRKSRCKPILNSVHLRWSAKYALNWSNQPIPIHQTNTFRAIVWLLLL